MGVTPELESRVTSLPNALPDVLEPYPEIRAMNYAPQKAQPFGDAVDGIVGNAL